MSVTYTKPRLTRVNLPNSIEENVMADDKSSTTTPSNNPYTQIHVVQSGDTLSKIAQKYYGDASLYTKIFQANRDVLSDPNKISPGQKLRIP